MTGLFAFTLGVATAEHLRSESDSVLTILVGTDTRRSSAMLAAAVTAGLSSRGVDVIALGVTPTPGVAHLVVALGAAAGVVVSASHNPYDDNGLKLFGSNGQKMTDAEELAIEAQIDRLDLADATLGLPPRTHEAIGDVVRYRYEEGHYFAHLLAHAPYLDGLRVGLDCANGAASLVAPRVFKQIGARLDVIHAAPNGVNINVSCGSTHPAAITARVRSAGLDVGIAFDGDADRALMVDRHGRLVSGDHMLAICAVVRGEKTVVATSMTNLGVERWLASKGIALERVQVGDRYVHERLIERGLKLGGEQSGHLLFLDRATTGDGVLTSLQVLSACRKSGVALEAWMDQIPSYPQVIVNVPVPNGAKAAIVELPAVAAALLEARRQFGEEGRVVLRPSGTEPLVRVMVEGPDQAQVTRVGDEIARAVRDAASPEREVAASPEREVAE
ncbi:phosphoglucosamine mutase [soil metagenome]